MLRVHVLRISCSQLAVISLQHVIWKQQQSWSESTSARQRFRRLSLHLIRVKLIGSQVTRLWLCGGPGRSSVRMSCPLSLPFDSIVSGETGHREYSPPPFPHPFFILSAVKSHLPCVFGTCRGVRPWHSEELCVCPVLSLWQFGSELPVGIQKSCVIGVVLCGSSHSNSGHSQRKQPD